MKSLQEKLQELGPLQGQNPFASGDILDIEHAQDLARTTVRVVLNGDFQPSELQTCKQWFGHVFNVIARFDIRESPSEVTKNIVEVAKAKADERLKGKS